MEEVQNIGTRFQTQPKLFSKYTYDDLEVKDETLTNYIPLDTAKAQVYLPHTAGRYQTTQFKKATMPLIERVVGGIMFHGRNTGKKLKAMRIMKQCLEIIELQTGQNPL